MASKHLLSRLVAALLLVLCAAASSGATTIINVARISWLGGGGVAAVDSNPVTVTIEPAPGSSIATYGVGIGDHPTPIAAPLCANGSGKIPTPLDPGFAAVAQTGATLVAADTVEAGGVVLFRLSATVANRDPAAIDHVAATIQTTGGDRETLTLAETSADSGAFLGYIQTRASSGPVPADCVLSVTVGDGITIAALAPDGSTILASAQTKVLANPFGLAFDSTDGTPVGGARITLVDAATGQPAQVRGGDGASVVSSTIVTGQPPGAGETVPAGGYRFPLVAPGRYRLIVQPPPNYVAPSTAPASQLAQLRRPDGDAFDVAAGSTGGDIVLAAAGPIALDIPLDPPAAAFSITKAASVAEAAPGDVVLYTVLLQNPDTRQAKTATMLTDVMPAAMRLRAGSIRVDSAAPAGNAALVSPDGRTLSIALGTMAPGAIHTIRYMLDVRLDAASGDALNHAQVTDARGEVAAAQAAVHITHETIAGRMTLVGRVLDGACDAPPGPIHGISGIRLMLEDGSYAVTDRDGRYHFDGLLPGAHVVQLDPDTLPLDRAAVDCTRSTRSGGSAISRYIEGQGGALLRADFHAAPARPREAPKAAPLPAQPEIATDPQAAGAGRDWFTGGSASIAWLFPEVEYNPRAPIARVVIRHLPDQKVELSANGQPVDPVTLDGSRKDASGSFAVTMWRGVPLAGDVTHLSAVVRGADGTVAARLTRDVRFTATAAHAVFLPEQSRLVADGITRPVIAVRLTDRDNHPLHHGLVGDYVLSTPYVPASEVDAEQARALAGLERAKPVWHVTGDSGIAYIELSPTTVSGAFSITFPFHDGDSSFEQRIDGWMQPGDRPWTVVGFAQGTAGFQTIDGHMEQLGQRAHRLDLGGRLAFYAKGRVLGKWLLTMSVDTARKADDARFGGTIDPDTYYTVYADGSERRFDAASIRKLYLRLETRQFYAMFGDYDSGMTETQLARYSRSVTGAKAEYRGKHIAATAFATTTPNLHRRDEIQGNGLTGPYALGARDVLANSEQVVIQVRDRLRSEKIVGEQTMARNIDYDIDYAAGTLRFRSPVLSRDDNLNPQFVVVDYELQTGGKAQLNAGARGSWTSTNGKVRIGATALRDEGDQGRTLLGGADARILLGKGTELRGEIAVSNAAPGIAANGTQVGGTAVAWLAQFEHHGPKIDLLAYAQSQGDGFGVGQQNLAETGRRKFGFDGKIRLAPALSASASAWEDDSLIDDDRRRAGVALVEYKHDATTYRAGITYAQDDLTDGTTTHSEIAQIGATRKFLKNKLELDAQGEFALGQAGSVDFPAQQHLSARYSITPDVQLVGIYEIAKGDSIDSRTARVGFDLKPWAGARLTSGLGQQDITEYGPRTFAAYGLAQSLQIGKRWSVDATLDGNRTLGGINPPAVINPAQPVSSGGLLSAGTLQEDFTAITAGATYRAGVWSGTGRAEYRFADSGNRAAITLGAIRQLGEGSALGGLFTWTKASLDGGAATRTASLSLSYAVRPSNSDWSILDRLEARSDGVRNAVLGAAAPVGGALLTVSGDVNSRRVVNSLSIDYSPQGHDEQGLFQRVEFSAFLGSRYVFDRYDEFDLQGFSNLFGLDARIGLGPKIELGLSASVRADVKFRSVSYAVGPDIGIGIIRNGLFIVGWNLVGFRDHDYEAQRYSRSGPYATFRFKFDQSTFAFLGIASR